VVDRAIIGSERVVDRKLATTLLSSQLTREAETGVITYTKGQGPIFSTHPMEKPYCESAIAMQDEQELM
jgi:tRNA-dihydrouridine synthase 2